MAMSELSLVVWRLSQSRPIWFSDADLLFRCALCGEEYETDLAPAARHAISCPWRRSMQHPDPSTYAEIVLDIAASDPVYATELQYKCALCDVVLDEQNAAEENHSVLCPWRGALEILEKWRRSADDERRST